MMKFVLATGLLLILAVRVEEPLLVTPLTEQERDGYVQVTRPLRVRMTFLANSEFDKIVGEEPGGRVLAASRAEGGECAIYMRAGSTIEVRPREGSAFWTRRKDGDAIAHEIVHCLRGKWHPEWSQIWSRR